MANDKTLCFICNENKITYPCKGCSKEFCLVDLTEHRQILSNELHHITNEYNEFKQTINEQKLNSQNFPLIEQINQWEIEPIAKIQQKAQEYREIVTKSSQTCFNDIDMKLEDLNEQIQQMQIENEFNETDLNYLRKQLIEIKQQLNNPSVISIISSKKPRFSEWKQNAIIVAGGIGGGSTLQQLHRPGQIFVDKNKNILIADIANHRIIEWKCGAPEGEIIAGGNEKGNGTNQLNSPAGVIIDQQNHSIIIADTGNKRLMQLLNKNLQIIHKKIHCNYLAMDNQGFLYVSDTKYNKVRRWKIGEYDNEGIIVAGGNGNGKQLNQLNSPTFIFVGEDQSVYVSDSKNHRVMKWQKGAKEGTIVAGGNKKGKGLNQLSCPQGVIVDQLGQIYVVDGDNHRIMRWCEENKQGEMIVGGYEEGYTTDQFMNPSSLSFDLEGNLYVSDMETNRIQKFVVIS
ncbi:unnamed protein product [Adineta steineri]|uniref:SMP-30/Gluconolactonase/LRE-like region domain-containing protein n=1 Tax=Adineta steineri TaxID=433720 RepID=A0A815HBJ7_9BILA|nr:unnamed protein product [Adineta steineri]CAF4064563.1 unnamed protein product [Adineta steineri]